MEPCWISAEWPVVSFTFLKNHVCTLLLGVHHDPWLLSNAFWKHLAWKDNITSCYFLRRLCISLWTRSRPWRNNAHLRSSISKFGVDTKKSGCQSKMIFFKKFFLILPTWCLSIHTILWWVDFGDWPMYSPPLYLVKEMLGIIIVSELSCML